MNEQMQADALQSRLHPVLVTHKESTGCGAAATAVHGFDDHLALGLGEGSLLKLGRRHTTSETSCSRAGRKLSLHAAYADLVCVPVCNFIARRFDLAHGDPLTPLFRKTP